MQQRPAFRSPSVAFMMRRTPSEMEARLIVGAPQPKRLPPPTTRH
jgi:hypothetical protein